MSLFDELLNSNATFATTGRGKEPSHVGRNEVANVAGIAADANPAPQKPSPDRGNVVARPKSTLGAADRILCRNCGPVIVTPEKLENGYTACGWHVVSSCDWCAEVDRAALLRPSLELKEVFSLLVALTSRAAPKMSEFLWVNHFKLDSDRINKLAQMVHEAIQRESQRRLFVKTLVGTSDIGQAHSIVFEAGDCASSWSDLKGAEFLQEPAVQRIFFSEITARLCNDDEPTPR